MDRRIPPQFISDFNKLLSIIDPQNGIRISFHHHLRMGDQVVEMVLDALQKYGLKDLVLCVSSVMGPACSAVLEAVRSGLVRSIETTGLKSPLSEAVMNGEIPKPVVFRSHGGRARAIRTGEIPIDIAFIAASAVDRVGNLNGTDGPNRFGSLGYAQVDAEYAKIVVAVTDYMSNTKLDHIAIPANQVDYVMKVDSIGDSSSLSGGSLRGTSSPIHTVIAKQTMEVLLAAGAVQNGWAYQAGSGAVSLLVTQMVSGYMREHGVQGSFASGGITGTLVELLKEGLFQELYDVQSFDLDAAMSLKENSHHREMSAAEYADPGIADAIAKQLDVMILSAAEVDTDFNINSLTGTNGKILGALGGAPDTAAGSKLTIAVLPSFRGRIPTLHKRVRTICTPGRDVDVVVTERGIAVNPQREDIYKSLFDSGKYLSGNLFTMDQLITKIHAITGTPDYPSRDGKVVGVVEYRDGSIIDTVKYFC
ncbi:MAG: citrate lyase subunit alpha [Bacteroidetes bacterium]|nr:citrate lyase subunit alpha [Bacteroidota bacterium]